jgi:hypothetical protein
VGSGGLVGTLIVIAGVILAATGAYPVALFDRPVKEYKHGTDPQWADGRQDSTDHRW